MDDDTLSPSEAVYAFAAWLTSREHPVTMSAVHDASPVAELLQAFCDSQGLEPPRSDYTVRLKSYPGEMTPEILSGVPDDPAAQTLHRRLAALLNAHNADTQCNTPDYVLAQYLLGCLYNLQLAVEARDRWHGDRVVPVDSGTGVHTVSRVGE